MKRIRIAIYLANALDHFDTSLYGFVVPIIAPLFFPNSDPIVAIIKGYGILIVGIITRPLGAWYFSKQADLNGPHQTLVSTIIGMTITTFCFTLLQPYQYWGIWGTIGLCLIRGMQNFFGAGETSIAGLYSLENTKSSQQHQISSFYLSSTMIGILLACGAASLLFYSKTPQAYWKLPFYASIITGITGIWLRCQSKPHSTNIYSSHDSIRQVNWQNVIRLIPITGFSYILYSAPLVFFNSFATLVTDLAIKDLMATDLFLMIFDLWLLTILGPMLRNFSAKKLLLLISLLSVILFPILFWFIPLASLTGTILIRIIMVILGVVFCIPLHRWYIEEFPANTRYSTTAIGYAIGSEVLGRSFPTVGLAIWHISNVAITPGIYIALVGMCTFLNLKNPFKKPTIN